MVYKNGKYGTHSGATLRKRNKRFQQRYNRWSYLKRERVSSQIDPSFKPAGLLGEGNTINEHCEYSLNKQRRWELPGILEDIILNHDLSQEETGFQLITKHRTHRTANCVSVVSSDGVYHKGKINPERKFKIKNSGGFFQANTVLKGNPAKTKRERRLEKRRQRQTGNNANNENENEAVPERAQLRYEVHIPTPETSVISMTPKQNGYFVTGPVGVYSYGRSPASGKGRKRTRFVQDIKDDMYEMDFQSSDNECDYMGECFEAETSRSELSVTMDEIVKHANKASTLLSTKRRRRSTGSSTSSECSLSNKGRVIYVDREEFSLQTMESETTPEISANAVSITGPEESVELLPVTVILNNEEVSENTLADRYGEAVCEAKCLPRTFTLNISDRIANTDLVGKRTNAFLVFIHDTYNDINNVKESVYRLYLNANVHDNIHSIKIETLFDYTETSVEEVIDRALFYIDTLPENALVYEPRSPNKSHQKISTVEQCAKWSSKSYRPSDNIVIATMFMEDRQNAEHDFKLIHGSEVLDQQSPLASDDQFCSICYEVLDHSRPGTCLTSCRHWFCNSCWVEYFNTQLKQGQIEMECPEYDCDMKVDTATFLSLVPVESVIRFARKCHDNAVETRMHKRWCPNTKCGRVVLVNSDEVKTAKCACGETFCLSCLKKSHWPAPCEAIALYKDTLRKTGDFTLEPEEVSPAIKIHGRNCPFCHRFVEKLGGCPYMYCVCKNSFCWGCGELWHSRPHNADCYKIGGKNKHQYTQVFKMEQDTIDKKKRAVWYKNAVRHRINQHPRRIHNIKSYVKTIRNRVQALITASERRSETIYLEFENGNAKYDTEAAKTNDFLRNTIDLLVEINSVVENTFVLLGSDNFPPKTRARLRFITNRLSTFSDVIYRLFTDHKSLPTDLLVRRFKETRVRCRHNVQSLVKLVKSLEM